MGGSSHRGLDIREDEYSFGRLSASIGFLINIPYSAPHFYNLKIIISFCVYYTIKFLKGNHKKNERKEFYHKL